MGNWYVPTTLYPRGVIFLRKEKLNTEKSPAWGMLSIGIGRRGLPPKIRYTYLCKDGDCPGHICDATYQWENVDANMCDVSRFKMYKAQLQRHIHLHLSFVDCPIPIPMRNYISPPNVIVIRSFAVNKPSFEVWMISKMGLKGGSMLKDVVKANQFIEFNVVRGEKGNIKYTPIYSRIVSLCAEQKKLQLAVHGGLMGVDTTMDDPTLTGGLSPWEVGSVSLCAKQKKLQLAMHGGRHYN